MMRLFNRLWAEDGQVTMKYVGLALLIAIVAVAACMWGWKVWGRKGACYGLLAVVAIEMLYVLVCEFCRVVGKVHAHFSSSRETIDGYKWSYSIIGDHVKVLAVSPKNGAVSIPGTLAQRPITSIEKGVFSGCSGLTSVTIPNGVTSIGDSAFSGCSGLTSVTIPNSVTSIGDSAFSGCSGLTSVTIPNGVTSIGDSAFSGCSGLTSVTIPNGVTSIGNRAFYGCRGLADAEGLVIVRNFLFNYYGMGGNVTIPDGVTSIGDSAFFHCSGLTSVTIPNSVTIIGDSAFSHCSGLTSVTIPNNVTSIGYGAFYGCRGLADAEGFVIVRNTLFNYYGMCGNVTIPDGVTSIGDSAFEGCNGLMNVVIPEGVVSIGYEAFFNCSGLTSVTIGKGVRRIGERAFTGCGEQMHVTFTGDAPYFDGDLLWPVPFDEGCTLYVHKGSTGWDGLSANFNLNIQYIEDTADTCESVADTHDDDAEGWCDDAEDEDDTPKTPVAVKGDWKTSDMPDRHEEFFIHRAINPAQMRVLRRGHVPREMEDKWFWYMEGDTLFAHRSWTGYCIYRIDFSTVNYHKVTVNRDPKQHNSTSVVENRETLTKLLDWWICSPYDYYNEWLAETADALKKAKKSSDADGAPKRDSDGRTDGGEKSRLRDRRKGLLWGLVVGDCLGSPIQFSGKDEHPWITEMVECPVFGLPPGYWTDDSSMAMCVMDSYVRRGGYDLKDIGNTFAKWFVEGYLSSIEGRAFDIGRATRAACLNIAYGHEYVYGQEDSQGNGSIMRFAPSYLIAQNESDPAKVMHEVSDLTHSSGKIREVVDKFARILDSHVAGRRTTEVSPYGTREEVNNSGWAVSTLDAALWAFNTTKTFEDGMVAAVNLGGDSDSIGAVYGQIAGAFYGFDAIPKRWVKAVKTWESVDAMIDGFLDVLETNCGLRG